MNRNLLAVILVSAVVSGCVSQKVNQVKNIGNEEICIIKNPQVRSAFVNAYIEALKNNNYAVSLKNDESEAKNCVITSTYTAVYKFHWGQYLSTAELKVFEKGTLIGQAKYKAPFASPAKHGRIAPKIAALSNELFPKR